MQIVKNTTILYEPFYQSLTYKEVLRDGIHAILISLVILQGPQISSTFVF